MPRAFRWTHSALGYAPPGCHRVQARSVGVRGSCIMPLGKIRNSRLREGPLPAYRRSTVLCLDTDRTPQGHPHIRVNIRRGECTGYRLQDGLGSRGYDEQYGRPAAGNPLCQRSTRGWYDGDGAGLKDHRGFSVRAGRSSGIHRAAEQQTSFTERHCGVHQE